jgi:hypothetical protein
VVELNKAERAKVKEIYRLMCEGMNMTAKRLMKELRDEAVKAGPSSEREEVSPIHDKTQIRDFSIMRVGGPLLLRR